LTGTLGAAGERARRRYDRRAESGRAPAGKRRNQHAEREHRGRRRDRKQVYRRGTDDGNEHRPQHAARILATRN
jgi:hypothetical protein